MAYLITEVNCLLTNCALCHGCTSLFNEIELRHNHVPKFAT